MKKSFKSKGTSEISEISETLFASFLISEFSNLSYIKNRKLGFKKLTRFPSFRVFDLVRNDRVIAAQSRYMRIQTNNFK